MAGLGVRSLDSRSCPIASADRPAGSTGPPCDEVVASRTASRRRAGLPDEGHRRAREDQPDVAPGPHALVEQQHELLVIGRPGGSRWK